MQTLAGLLGGNIGAAQSLMNAIHADTGAISGVPLPPAYGGAYATGGVVSAAAAGGVQQGGWHLYGEHGPELGWLAAGTEMKPNFGGVGFGQMGGAGGASGLGGGGGGDTHVHIHGDINLPGVQDPERFLEEIQKVGLRWRYNQGYANPVFGR